MGARVTRPRAAGTMLFRQTLRRLRSYGNINLTDRGSDPEVGGLATTGTRNNEVTPITMCVCVCAFPFQFPLVRLIKGVLQVA